MYKSVITTIAKCKQKHMCLIYDNTEEQIQIVVPFIKKGLEVGAKCIYVADDNSVNSIKKLLGESSEIDNYINREQLLLLTKKDTYLKDGQFDPDTMIEFLLEVNEAAKKEGYKQIFLSGEMTWALDGNVSGTKLLEYEAKVNLISDKINGPIICQYNKERFSSEVLQGILHTHPTVIYKNMVSDNAYFVPPEEFLAEKETNREFERLLTNIITRQNDIDLLRRQRSELEETHRKLHEEFQRAKLAENKAAHLGKLIQRAKEAILIANQNYEIIFMNKSAEELFEWNLEEELPKSLIDFAMIAKEKLQFIQSILLSHKKWGGELRLKTASGKNIYTDIRTSLIEGSNGDPYSILFIINDITRRKQLENRLEQYERVKHLGKFTASIIHDLNNVFTPLQMRIDLLQYFIQSEKGKENLLMMEENILRGKHLLEQLIRYQRGTEYEPEIVNGADFFKSVVSYIRSVLPPTIELKTEIAFNGDFVADPIQLERVIINLTTNAIDAMKDGGILSIHMKSNQLLHNNGDNDECNEYVIIEVEDTGLGMTEEQMNNIFEPFYTTKRSGNGLGLGLAIIKNIIDLHNGYIDVESKEGESSKFKIFIPCNVYLL